jgi:DNA-binding protein YbaB
MTNERAKDTMAAILDGFTEQMRMIAEIQRKRAELIARGSAEGGRVTVTVNADGVVIETRFAEDIDDLDYDRIARAVTEAAQQAAATMARTCRELAEPLAQRRAQQPRLEELIEGMPDLRRRIPTPPRVSTAPPAERASVTEVGGPTLDTTSPQPSRGSGVVETGW